MEQQDKLHLLDVASKAPNRRKLYDILQKVYDLPNFGPAVTTDYLREIMKKESRFLKVKRDETHTIPKGTRRNYNSIETLQWLIKILKNKNKKECGFSSYQPPNLAWMLRIIIWADPTQKDVIFKKSVQDFRDSRKDNLENQFVDIDPSQSQNFLSQFFSIKEIFDQQVPCRSVSNQNYRMYMDNFNEEEQRKLKNIKIKREQAKVRAIKLKIQMERALQEQHDAEKLQQIYQQQLELKKQKQQIIHMKKVQRKKAMARQNIKLFLDNLKNSLLSGEIPQTPLVNKFFQMQVNSQKKKKKRNNLPQQNLLAQFDGKQQEEEMKLDKDDVDQIQQMIDPFASKPLVGQDEKQIKQRYVSKRRQVNERKAQDKKKKRLSRQTTMELEGNG